MKRWIEWFLGSNDLSARLLRTVVEAILGVFVANLDIIFQNVTLPAEAKTIIVGAVVAIVSPILALLKQQINSKQQDDENSENSGIYQ